MSDLMNIGAAARAAGVSAKMIRHYERLGLMPAAARTEAGYRLYAEHDVAVLRFIRCARRLGFAMTQIAELLALWRDTDRTSRDVKQLAERHVADLGQKIAELTEMKQALERLVAHCQGNEHTDCAILDGLAVNHAGQDRHTSGASLGAISTGRRDTALRMTTPRDELMPTPARDSMDWSRSWTTARKASVPRRSGG